MSYAADFFEGVRDLLAEAGEDGQIIRTTTERSPTNPTQMVTVTKTYTARMFFDEPRKTYVTGGVQVETAATLYVDWLSLVDTDTDTAVNTLVDGEPVITLETSQGDVAVRANGENLTLLVNIAPNINGVTVVGQHEVER